jgi:NADH-quinone oxidoreductase subunit N
LISAAIPNFTAALAEVIVTLGILAEVIASVWLRQNAQRSLFYGAMAIVTVALGALFWQLGHTGVSFGEQYMNDFFTLTTKAFVLAITLVAIYLMHFTAAGDETPQNELPILVLTSLLGMMLMVSANNMLILFLGIELQSLSIYTLVAIRRHNIYSHEAALKYFILGALSTGFMLYGISFIYGLTGTLSFDALHRFFKASTFVGFNHITPYIGLFFVLAGLAFKVAAVPFHFWVPDVYQGSPTTVVTFVATAPKFAGLAVMVQLLAVPFLGAAKVWGTLLAVMAVGSMFVGATAALVQTNIKRLMAYSSIGQVGFSLLGLAVANEQGAQSALAYMGLYTLTLLGFFGILLHVKRRGLKVRELKDLGAISTHCPYSAIGLGILLLSMAGVPPLPGFLTKLYVLQGAMAFNHYTLAFLGVIYSVIAVGYALILLKALFFDKTEGTSAAPKPYLLGMNLVLIALIGLMALLLWDPAILFDITTQSSGALFFER